MPVRYNKGEWSEFYVFLKSLADKKLFILAENQEATNDFYTLLKVKRTENNINVDYVLQQNQDNIIKQRGKNELIIPVKIISEFLPNLLNQIISTSGASFEVNGIDSILNALDTQTIKEGSSADKADITLVIDYKEQLNKTLGFNIKSNIGSKPTLLNASQATNFIYEIQDFDGDIEELNSYEGNSKIRDRIRAIRDGGGKFVFYDVGNAVFKQNLMKIDTQLPEIISSLLLNYFAGNGHNIQEVVNSCNSLQLSNCVLSRSELMYKMKKFLVANALGFFPSKPWNGYNKAQGYIIVKRNGDIGCFDVFLPEILENYLYTNVKFDTPSSSRHGFGVIYEQNGKKYIKLNLQIRFV